MIEKRTFALKEVRFLPKAEKPEDATRHDGWARGYASVFNSDSEDLGGFVERVAPTAFNRSIAAAHAGEINVFAFWAHDDSQVIGSTRSGTLELEIDEHGLAFRLNPERLSDAQRMALRDGDMKVSFGFSVRSDAWEKRDGYPLRTLNDVDLFEISPVAIPAYPDTEAALRSLEAWRSKDEPIVIDVPAEIETAEASPLNTTIDAIVDHAEEQALSEYIATMNNILALQLNNGLRPAE